jgi:hypothetical protein
VVLSLRRPLPPQFTVCAIERGREPERRGGIISTPAREHLSWRSPQDRFTGGDLVSTGTAKQRGACQGAEPCESSAIANLTANDETYALAAYSRRTSHRAALSSGDETGNSVVTARTFRAIACARVTWATRQSKVTGIGVACPSVASEREHNDEAKHVVLHV